jgi:uncharacterized protein YidB (DUF937 family)
MSILNSILGALTGNSSTGNADPLQVALSGLLTQNGGIEGLMNKFNQGGLGEVFTSWVGLDANQSISADQINKILGSDAVQSLASSLGIDATKASGFLADYLPKIVDKLTPSGQIGAGGDLSQGIAALLPSLLENLGGKPGGAA